MSNVMPVEVPLITPEHSAGADRFTIQNDLSVIKGGINDDREEGKEAGDVFWDGNEDEWKERVHGCAATHFVKESQTLIRTSACVEEPYVISIAKINMDGEADGVGSLSNSNNGSETALECIELDLSHLDASIMGTIIKTFIFQIDTETDDGDDDMAMSMENADSAPIIKIVLVDSQANILSIALDARNLKPTIAATHTCIASILSNQNIHPQARYSLTSTQIIALDSNRLVIAITPFIFCVNLQNQKVSSWSKESCHYNRRKSLTGVFKSAKVMLVGKSIDAEEEFIESAEQNTFMASTAALCVFDKVDEYTGVDVSAKVVCSLHADGTVRMWTCALSSQSFTYPRQMRVLYGVEDVNGNGMPLPHMWSSSSDSLLIDGHSNVARGDGSAGVEFIVAVGIRIMENVGLDRTSSPFYLTILRGDFTSTVESVEKTAMSVPKEVESVKAMNFVKTDEGQNEWELCALYSSIPERKTNDSGSLDTSMYASFSRAPLRKTMVAVYHSNSPEPTCVNSSNMFDTYAEIERENIIHECNLMARNGLLLDDESQNEAINVTLRRLDGWYLQRIFRSRSVQTVGLDKATDGAIRRALRQVVPPLCIDDCSQKDLNGCSIELETLNIMDNWANVDETRSGTDGLRHVQSQGSARKTDTTQTSSIYSDFYHSNSHRSQTPEIREDSDDGMESTERSFRDRKIQRNHNRWKKLLLAICHEEAKLLSPIGFSVLQPSATNLILRAGITSTIFFNQTSSGNARNSQLDSIMISMLDRIENAEARNNREILSWLEAKVYQSVSKAKMLEMDNANDLKDCVNDAISNLAVDGWDRVYSKLLIILNTMSQKEVLLWLSTPLPSYLLPRVEESSTGLYRTAGSSFIIPNASRLMKQYIAGCQRLALARYICINGIEASGHELFNPEQERVSLVAYLHTVATSWTCAQLLTSVSESKMSSNQHEFSAPPRNHGKKTTVLAVNLMSILKSQSISVATKPIISSIINLSRSCIGAAFQMNEGDFPELAIVPQNFPEDAARISLRLLAPLVAFPRNDPRSKSRNMKAADCLLSEVFALCRTDSLSILKAKNALEHAFMLLKDGPTRVPDPDGMNIFLSTLRSLNAVKAAPNDSHDRSIVDTIQHMFDTASVPGNHDDVLSLSRMEKMKQLLLPWVIASNGKNITATEMILESLGRVTENPTKIISNAMSTMLGLSKLVERVQVFEKHDAMLKLSPLRDVFARVLISAINDVIDTLQKYAHSEDFIHIVEYPALWSALFRNALQGHCWEDAFQACLSNPINERRTTNFQRLVVSMVNAGALGTLLEKMIRSIVHGHDESNEDIDLYELAAETLGDVSQRASGERMMDSDKNDVDYRGCLYALHAANGNWRRSCQAIDFLGALALRRIKGLDDGDGDSISSSPVKNEGNDIIMDELVLSAVASAQLIQLVENPNLRYIVSGELSPSSVSIQVNGHEDDQMRGDKSSNEVADDDTDKGIYCRSSRLYSHNDLLLRAKRLIALQVLQRDSLSPDNLLEILNASDTSIIDALPRLGYYEHAIAFSHCKEENKNGAKPHGRDVFVDAISHMLCKCLAPVAFTMSRSLKDDTDIEVDGNIQSRPTIYQLRSLTGDNHLSFSQGSWLQEEIVGKVGRGSSAMELLRLYTESYAAEDNSIALDLADALLCLDEGKTALPVWLVDLIIGRSVSDNNGLFAKNGGNPTVLLNLYIKNGLYIEACSLISAILLGVEIDRQKAATSRLPEKGNIDFVPYETVDDLWNLINACLTTEIDPIRRVNLLKARNSIERSLEKHFQLMQASEHGMLSARALNSR